MEQGPSRGLDFLAGNFAPKGWRSQDTAKKLPKKKILYTFCVVGMRAKTAAYELSKHGYKVRAVKPGYDKLLKAGFKKAEPTSVKDEVPRQRDPR